MELKEVICLAENVPTTQFYVFASTHFQGATLIVPETSIYLYNAQYPWSDFGDIVPYSFDYEVVNSVIANINAIGEVTYSDASRNLIDAARTSYDALSDIQKALVTNVGVLLAAEEKYEELHQMDTGINSVSANDAENTMYDLSGRKLSKKPVTKGVYILKGKTVFIK